MRLHLLDLHFRPAAAIAFEDLVQILQRLLNIRGSNQDVIKVTQYFVPWLLRVSFQMMLMRSGKDAVAFHKPNGILVP